MDFLHQLGPRIVVISSTFLSDDQITLFASKIAEDKSQLRVKVDIPKVGAPGQHFTGTGDLLSAMLLAKIHEFPDDFAQSIEQAANIVRGVLLKSIEEPLVGTNEISLIASKSVIENPPNDLKAIVI